jgi:hypothetical protein
MTFFLRITILLKYLSMIKQKTLSFAMKQAEIYKQWKTCFVTWRQIVHTFLKHDRDWEKGVSAFACLRSLAGGETRTLVEMFTLLCCNRLAQEERCHIQVRLCSICELFVLYIGHQLRFGGGMRQETVARNATRTRKHSLNRWHGIAGRAFTLCYCIRNGLGSVYMHLCNLHT